MTGKEELDPYEVLRVTRDADEATIKKAYRRLAREYHPGRNPNDRAAEADSGGQGSGLEGVARRIGEAGGTLDVRRGKSEFTVIVTVPATLEGAR